MSKWDKDNGSFQHIVQEAKREIANIFSKMVKRTPGLRSHQVTWSLHKATPLGLFQKPKEK